ncbi:hypothetical protein CJ030_MR6G016520 [Morella rubra]|uniref:Uncharacterized protein n=1 Tax=Morella rubra TaxID=262757 RepID=A0A6A1VC49_9ROSI|nr:hypothetical protein CJ030_MR6G016520 [Morella rubra]
MIHFGIKSLSVMTSYLTLRLTLFVMTVQDLLLLEVIPLVGLMEVTMEAMILVTVFLANGGDDGGAPGPSEIPRDPSKGKQPITEECISDDNVSDIGRSDVLESPKVSEAEDDVINTLPKAYPNLTSAEQAPPPTQSTLASAQQAPPTTQPDQSRENKCKKSKATSSQAARLQLQENETVPVEILSTQTQTPIYGQNEENVLSQPPAARTRSGGKKIIPPPVAPRTIPQPAAPQTPVTSVVVIQRADQQVHHSRYLRLDLGCIEGLED